MTFNDEKEEKLKEIMRLVEEYHDIAFAQKKFEPGVSVIPPSGKLFDSSEMKSLVESALDGWWTEGRFTRKFSKQLAEYVGTKYCMLTNSGSSANLLALSALTSPLLRERRIKPGDEVISVAASFPTTVNPIIQNGCVPVFVDAELGTYNIDTTKLEGALSDKTKAIFIAHTLGNPFNLESVVSFAKEHNLWLIEDGCDALGAEYEGKRVGSFGDISTLSLYPAHHITTGEGGAVFTSNSFLKRAIESFRDWGRDCWCAPGDENTCGKRYGWKLGELPEGYDHKYIYSHTGFNLKMTDMQAALGIEQLKKVDDFIEARRDNFNYYKDGLQDYQDYIILPKATEKSNPSWFGFLITVKDEAPFKRSDILEYLGQKRIGTRLLFGGNITKQPYFSNLEYRVAGLLENADTIMNNTFWIGVQPNITPEKREYVLESLKKFFSKYYA